MFPSYVSIFILHILERLLKPDELHLEFNLHFVFYFRSIKCSILWLKEYFASSFIYLPPPFSLLRMSKTNKLFAFLKQFLCIFQLNRLFYACYPQFNIYLFGSYYGTCPNEKKKILFIYFYSEEEVN